MNTTVGDSGAPAAASRSGGGRGSITARRRLASRGLAVLQDTPSEESDRAVHADRRRWYKQQPAAVENDSLSERMQEIEQRLQQQGASSPVEPSSASGSSAAPRGEDSTRTACSELGATSFNSAAPTQAPVSGRAAAPVAPAVAAAAATVDALAAAAAALAATVQQKPGTGTVTIVHSIKKKKFTVTCPPGEVSVAEVDDRFCFRFAFPPGRYTVRLRTTDPGLADDPGRILAPELPAELLLEAQAQVQARAQAQTQAQAETAATEQAGAAAAAGVREQLPGDGGTAAGPAPADLKPGGAGVAAACSNGDGGDGGGSGAGDGDDSSSVYTTEDEEEVEPDPRVIRGLELGRTYWCDILEEPATGGPETGAAAPRRVFRAANSAAVVSGGMGREPSRIPIDDKAGVAALSLGEDKASCSCLYGNPCVSKYNCANWPNRYFIAKANGWKGHS